MKRGLLLLALWAGVPASAGPMREPDAHRLRAALHGFFTCFEGGEQPVERLLERLDPRGFAIRSSRTRLESEKDLRAYFGRLREGQWSAHRVMEFTPGRADGEQLTGSATVLYLRWDPPSGDAPGRLNVLRLRYGLTARRTPTGVLLKDIRYAAAGAAEPPADAEAVRVENVRLERRYLRLAER